VITEDGSRRHREVQGGSGYLSFNPTQQHVGVAAFATASARITWPNGDVQTAAGLDANVTYEVRQGQPGAQRVD
jgi:hypothetical protein